MLNNECVDNNELVEYRASCPFCGAVNVIKVPKLGLQAYNNGALVQRAFPNLTAAERELIITGICSKCWDRCFGGDDEN